MKSLLIALVLALGLTLSGPLAHAGFIEIGASGNFKRVNVADDVLDTQTSLTGTLAYYFTEMTALELSYTDGQQKSEVKSTVGLGQTISVNYSMVGLDFILTLGARDAILRPYFKAGAAYILEKKRTTVFEFNPAASSVSEEEPALVPSGGIGFRLLLAKGWSLKAGIDAWSSKSVSDDNVKVDYAGRIGLSWMF
ncbi:MAG: porin family protein [Bdellovibrionaceae bacterium]|nr:porin family protein [Pseudobdellovibrionaceae bacterium]